MTEPCVSHSFAPGTELQFAHDRVSVEGPFITYATSDGPSNTARLLIDQTVDWTMTDAHKALVHVMFQRPPRSVRTQGPIRHFIEEKWAITIDGSAPSLPGSLITSFGGGVDRNQSNFYLNEYESGHTYMPSGLPGPGGLNQVVRTTGQQIRIRYQANMTISAAGGANMDVRSYWHGIYIVKTSIPLTP